MEPGQVNNAPQTADQQNPADQKAALQSTLDEAHHQYADFVTRKRRGSTNSTNVLRMKSYLTNDEGGYLKAQTQVEAGIEIKLDPEGATLGTGKYEQLDPGWELIARTELRAADQGTIAVPTSGIGTGRGRPAGPPGYPP